VIRLYGWNPHEGLQVAALPLFYHVRTHGEGAFHKKIKPHTDTKSANALLLDFVVTRIVFKISNLEYFVTAAQED
jgi:hypothetical protein